MSVYNISKMVDNLSYVITALKAHKFENNQVRSFVVGSKQSELTENTFGVCRGRFISMLKHLFYEPTTAMECHLFW